MQEGDPGYEACDDGNAGQTDACLNDCSVAQAAMVLYELALKDVTMATRSTRTPASTAAPRAAAMA